MSKYKVSIIVPGRWHAFYQAQVLQEYGLLEKLVTSYPKFKTREWGIHDSHVESLFWHYISTMFLWKFGGEALDIRLGGHLHRLFGKLAMRHLGNANIVHGWAGVSLFTMYRKQELGVSAVVLDRGSAHRLSQDSILAEEYEQNGLCWPKRPIRQTQFECLEYEHADAITVPSVFVRKTFLDHEVDERKIFQNGYGVNLEQFFPQLRRHTGFKVIYAGSLSLRKGIQYLVEGFLRANILNSELMFVGGMTEEIRKSVDFSDSRIRHLGHLPQKELPEIYRSGDIFVLPSLEEGQAMVQFQALACGLPLICTTNTGGEDLLMKSGVVSEDTAKHIKEFKAGFVVRPRDSFAIAECLLKLSKNVDILSEKKNAAVALCADDFSWMAHGLRNIALYEQLLNGALQ